MDYKSIIGVCLLATGIVILMATLYLAYGLYNTAMHASTNQVQQKPANLTVSNKTTQSALMSAMIGAVISSMMSQMPVEAYANSVIAAVFLALFASIGYKISMLGIRMLAVGSGKDAGK